MGVDFSGGADALHTIQQRMGTLADGRIPDAAGDALQESVPLVEAAGRKGAQSLPSGGGLAARVEGNLKLNTTLRRGERADLNVTVLPSNQALRDPAAANRGRLRRPTFGHKPYVIQLITPGWWSNAMRKVAPEVRDKVRTAIADSIRR